MSLDRPYILSIAGFDPCGGAGVLADTKTFEALQVQGMSVTTANTIQTENSLSELKWENLDFVCQSISTLMTTYLIKVVKIGVVPDFSFLKVLVQCIRAQNQSAFIIWDPVIKSSSGTVFFDLKSLPPKKEIELTIDLITPNVIEYKQLKPYLSKGFAKSVLIKGGHKKDQKGLDVLKTKSEEHIFPGGEQKVFAKHGSGCVLSAAIGAYLAKDQTLVEACRLGKNYVENFLSSNPSLLGFHDLR